MRAKMKCSNCGAEMSNLNFTWGKKYLFLMIPIMILGMLPLIKMTLFKGDPRKELVISGVRTRSNGGTLEITGLITNKGSHEWSSVTVEVEFFDKNKVFIDEKTDYLNTHIAPNDEEHFKISIRDPDPQLLDVNTEMKVKISGGHTSPF